MLSKSDVRYVGFVGVHVRHDRELLLTRATYSE